MAFIHWQDFMFTGIPKLDREHRDILTLLNRLGECIDTRQIEHARVIGLRLFLEVCSHFADEEEWMGIHGYDGLEAHRRIHADTERTMGQLDAVLCWAEPDTAEVAATYRAFLSHFDRDFFEADRRFALFLAGLGRV